MKRWPWRGKPREEAVPDRRRPEEWERVPEPLATKTLVALRAERVEDPEVMDLVLSGALWSDGNALWLRRERTL
jgi:hypothetical protein